jgi:hypothetical protein
MPVWQAPGNPSEFHERLDETKAPLRHSGWAAASLALFFLACLFEYGLVKYSLMEHEIRKANEAKGIQHGDVGSGFIVVFNLLAGGFTNFIGAILGLIALTRPKRKRSYAAWSLALNVALPILNICYLLALG